MEILFDKGIALSLNNQKLYLDPETSKVPIKSNCLVSHSHSDHSAGLGSDGASYSTAPTESLFKSLHPKKLRNNVTLDFNSPIEIGDFQVELFRAGHLLGAAQILVRTKNMNVFFTGDFCPDNLLTVNKAEFPKDGIDVLIIETTYGNPVLSFPDRQNARMDLLNWVIQKISNNVVPVINVAQLGGAQELITLFNQFLMDIPVYVHPRICKLNSVFQNHGVKLQYSSVDQFGGGDMGIILIPRGEKTLPSVLKEKKIARGMVTGQSIKFSFRSYEYTAALTTHATYHELIKTVKLLSPQLVVTRYSYEEKFAETVKQTLGIHAIPSKFLKKKQVNLSTLVNKPKNLSLLNFLD